MCWVGGNFYQSSKIVWWPNHTISLVGERLFSPPQSIYFLTLTQSVETIPAAGTFFGRLDSLTKKKFPFYLFWSPFLGSRLHGGVLTLFNVHLFYQTENKKISGFSLQDIADFKMEFFTLSHHQFGQMDTETI